MPVMNGFEFLDRYAQEFEVHAPVVAMLTSSHLGRDRERAMQYSFVKSYFEKPLQADHLRTMRNCWTAEERLPLPNGSACGFAPHPDPLPASGERGHAFQTGLA